MIGILKAKFTDKLHLPPEWPAKMVEIEKSSDVEPPWEVMTKEEFENHKKRYQNDYEDFLKKQRKKEEEQEKKERDRKALPVISTQRKLRIVGFDNEEIKVILGNKFIEENDAT